MVQDLSPSLIMVLVQLEFAVMNISSKLALDSGMNPFIHVAYRQLFAAVTLLPLAYFIERGKTPPMTLYIFFEIFFFSMGWLTMNQITYFVGLKNSTPTIACALSNLLPALTFVTAVIAKLESAKLKTLTGQAKLIGTLAGVGGEMLLSLYHGPVVHIGESSIHLKIADMAKDQNQNGEGNLQLGPLFFILSGLTWAVWFVMQAKRCHMSQAPYPCSALMLAMGTVECSLFGFIMEPHPLPYLWSALMLAMGSVECSLFAFFMEPYFDFDIEWSLAQPIRAFSSIYAGVVCSAIGVCMTSWCIKRKGPLFVSVFSPLLVVMVAALSWAFLREKLYLGTVLGSVLLVMGLYGVLWGKSKEMEPRQQELEDTKEDMEMQ